MAVDYRAAATQLLKCGYAVIWERPDSTTSQGLRELRATGRVACQDLDDLRFADIRAQLTSPGHAAHIDGADGFVTFDGESVSPASRGRVNWVYRSRGRMHPTLASAGAGRAGISEINDLIVKSQTNSYIITHVANALLLQIGLIGTDSVHASLGLHLYAIAADDDSRPGPAASSLAVQYYPNGSSTLEGHTDCTLLTVVAPGAGDPRFEVWDAVAKAYVKPAVSSTEAGEPLILVAGHLLDVILGLKRPIACQHRLVPSSSKTPRTSVVFRFRPRDDAAVQPNVRKTIAAVVAEFRASHSSVNATAGMQVEPAGSRQAANHKRRRGEPEAAKDDTLTILLVLNELPGESEGIGTVFKVKQTTKFEKVFAAYYDRQGQSPGTFTFVYKGETVEGSIAPIDYKMNDGDKINVYFYQTGD